MRAHYSTVAAAAQPPLSNWATTPVGQSFQEENFLLVPGLRNHPIVVVARIPILLHACGRRRPSADPPNPHYRLPFAVNLPPRLHAPAFALTLFITAAAASTFPTAPAAWPPVTQTAKPWTRWWWLGSGVDAPNLTRELENLAKAGIGGVEICPIYEAVGAERRSLPFLSPPWIEALAHTANETRRLDLGLDLTTGTGWPFGGPWVTPDMASSGLRQLTHQTDHTKGTLTLKLPEGNLQYLRAFPTSGQALDLSHAVTNGILSWTPPEGHWTICALTRRSPIQKVKRAAPGGAGNVLDPYATDSLHRYLEPFTQALAPLAHGRIRAHFHDSFEYYGADWTPELFDRFRTARGYDLRDQLPAFHGIGQADAIQRVRADFRETLGDLHRDYLTAWNRWAATQGSLTRNQAHGSPGNLLDHYAVANIPETEIFRKVDDEQLPMLRLAASAAHSNDRTLVSAESFTWLGEHFRVTPAELKDAADFLFLGGVNHLFFHGVPYSPADAPWPGWLFYASTHLGPHGGLWHDLPAFTRYLQQCQSILQHGEPDSEVLVYFPFADLLHDGAEKLPLFTVHNQDQWLYPTRFHQTAMELWNIGITHDFASDRMLARATVEGGRVILGNNTFKAVVIPAAKYMPEATLERLLTLAEAGARVILHGGWPTEVPGFHRSAARTRELATLRRTRGKALVECHGYLAEQLAQAGVSNEIMTRSGLRFVRRRHAEGHHYFIANRSQQPFDATLPLAVPFTSAVILDPWNPEHPVTLAPDTPAGGIPIQLAPGASVLVRTFTRRKLDPTPKRTEFHQPVDLDPQWKLEFIDGGPALPPASTLESPAPWTTIQSPATQCFAGTARYSTTFKLTETSDALAADLGTVHHTARILIDGQPAAISWCPPHTHRLNIRLEPGTHTVAIEVTNLAANRIADLDRRKVSWKNFHEINFVNIDYKPFDASAWPVLVSGLEGPVRITAIRSR